MHQLASTPKMALKKCTKQTNSDRALKTKSLMMTFTLLESRFLWDIEEKKEQGKAGNKGVLRFIFYDEKK